MKRLSLPFTFRLPCLAYFLFLFSGTPSVQGLPLIKEVPYQPLVAATQRLMEALEFYSRDQDPREAKLAFNVGQGTQDLGFRNAVSILSLVLLVTGL